MCIFSQRVEVVSNTNIFARGVDGKQFLVYSMNYAAGSDLAMVLPLPVPPRPAEDAVRFINLQRYSEFFDDMAKGFVWPRREGGRTLRVWRGRAEPTLQVHDVGDFEASFIPRLEDFDRLDERFRLPRDAWDRLPAYRDYGFAVFKLKRSPDGLGLRRVHPMAFEFPRRNPDLLYFPTLHIHDREIHPRAEFDHMLYCQVDAMDEANHGWNRARDTASTFMDVKRTDGIVLGERLCWRMPLRGELENKDTLVDKNGMVPVALKV